MNHKKPSEIELQVLSILWESAPMTVRELLDAMPDGKKRAYTTVLSILQVMEKKELVARHREGQTDHWKPIVQRDRILGSFFSNMIGHLFAGSPSAALQQLLATQPVDGEELKAIKKMIREYESKKKEGNKNDA